MADVKFSQFSPQNYNLLPGDKFAGLRSGVNTIFTSQFGEVLVCQAAQPTPLTVTYNNGLGTLTDALGTFLPLSPDGVTLSVGVSRVLISQQASAFQNGIYVLTQQGDGISVPWVLTRTTDFNSVNQMIPGRYVVISSGNSLASSMYVLLEPQPAVIGVDAIEFFSMLELAIANQPAHTLLGNPTGGFASAEPITLGAGLAFSGSTLVATAGNELTALNFLLMGG